MNAIRCALPIAICAALAAPVQAGQCSARSGAQTTALVELYTSEGCDSCPPADRWLSTLASRGFDLARVVPIALHVDYWDYLGWKDPYAKARFSARQKRLGQAQGVYIGYTPEVMLQGRDFRSWSGPQFGQEVARINASPARAHITLKLSALGAGPFRVAVLAALADPASAPGAQLFLAAYESKLVSHVAAGENGGKTLTHDYVVRDWVGPLELGADGWLAAERDLPLLPGAVRANSGVVGFVQLPSSGVVLQAVMLPAC